MSSAFLRIGWPSAVVGEARPQKPAAQNTNNGLNIHQLNFMKPEWMSSAFLRIGWPSAVVGEAGLQKPAAQNTNNGFNSPLKFIK
ncbi:MAG: hypothetical protein ABIO55_03605 [Ginsengibacter sp.]